MKGFTDAIKVLNPLNWKYGDYPHRPNKITQTLNSRELSAVGGIKKTERK